MPHLLDSDEFRPDTLSVREREVVDLAIDGLTDDMISHAMGISTSTVNSYWVRIRGKLGQHSRTELVARMIHLGYKDTHAGLLAEVERVSGLLVDSDANLSRARSDLVAERGVSWHLLALHFVPDAILVAKAPGVVVYANLQAERLFQVDPGYLTGREGCELAVSDDRDARRQRIRAFMEAGHPGRLVMGIEEPCFAQRQDDGNFRATISIEGFESPEGFMAVFTVREFLGDVDAVLKSLRRPLTIA